MKPAPTEGRTGGCPPALHHVTDDSPDFNRRILDCKPIHPDLQSKRIRDARMVAYLNALAIHQPAY